MRQRAQRRARRPDRRARPARVDGLLSERLRDHPKLLSRVAGGEEGSGQSLPGVDRRLPAAMAGDADGGGWPGRPAGLVAVVLPDSAPSGHAGRRPAGDDERRDPERRRRPGRRGRLDPANERLAESRRPAERALRRTPADRARRPGRGPRPPKPDCGSVDDARCPGSRPGRHPRRDDAGSGPGCAGQRSGGDIAVDRPLLDPRRPWLGDRLGISAGYLPERAGRLRRARHPGFSRLAEELRRGGGHRRLGAGAGVLRLGVRGNQDPLPRRTRRIGRGGLHAPGHDGNGARLQARAVVEDGRRHGRYGVHAVLRRPRRPGRGRPVLQPPHGAAAERQSRGRRDRYFGPGDDGRGPLSAAGAGQQSRLLAQPARLVPARRRRRAPAGGGQFRVQRLHRHLGTADNASGRRRFRSRGRGDPAGGPGEDRRASGRHQPGLGDGAERGRVGGHPIAATLDAPQPE